MKVTIHSLAILAVTSAVNTSGLPGPTCGYTTGNVMTKQLNSRFCEFRQRKLQAHLPDEECPTGYEYKPACNAYFPCVSIVDTVCLEGVKNRDSSNMDKYTCVQLAKARLQVVPSGTEDCPEHYKPIFVPTVYSNSSYKVCGLVKYAKDGSPRGYHQAIYPCKDSPGRCTVECEDGTVGRSDGFCITK